MKNATQKIGRGFYALRQKLGLVFYLHQQRYRVLYRTQVKNISNHTIAVSVLLPIPPNNHFQKALADPILSPAAVAVRTDATFGNQYAVWDVSLDPHSPLAFQEEIEILVHPRRSEINKNFQLRDYRTSDPLYLLYTKPNQYLPSNRDRFQQLAKDIIRGETRISKIISMLNDYVINNLSYGNPTEGLYTAEDAITKRQVDCGGFDALLATLSMSVGIPVRIVSGFWAGYQKNEMHAWVEFFLPDGSWFPADPSMEHLGWKNRTRKSGALGFTGSDRIALSIGCDIPLEANARTEYTSILQNPVLISKDKEFLRASADFITHTL